GPMSFGPCGRSSAIPNVPVPVERSGAKVSPRPPTVAPPAGRPGTCVAKPMSEATGRAQVRGVYVYDRRSDTFAIGSSTSLPSFTHPGLSSADTVIVYVPNADPVAAAARSPGATLPSACVVTAIGA